jgi:hypothetical protein
MADEARKSVILDFEHDAEVLFVQHLDLLAQLESQLRAVHHTMRGIERLRGGSRRVTPEVTNGERETILLRLAKEIDDLDRQVAIEHECCRAMHMTIVGLQQAVATLKRLATDRLQNTREPAAPDDADQSA